jgi:hypothetical protein
MQTINWNGLEIKSYTWKEYQDHKRWIAFIKTQTKNVKK